MKVTLLVSEWCSVCPNAERIWRQVNEEKDFELEVLDVAQPEGRKVVAEKLIKTVPATLVDDALKKVGVPGAEEARELVRCAPPREGGGEAREEAGATMTMRRGPRHMVRASVVYLTLAGLTLVGRGDLLGGGIGLFHLFTYGFLVFMIFGVAEHMLPRFTGHAVRTGWLPSAQLAFLHGGLWLFVAGRWLGGTEMAGGGALLMWGGVLAASARLLPLVWRPSTAERAASAEVA
ncbi:glutaredoxin family protein [Thiohalorhabdus sp. Cl-TMA]|uniref:Glutaredoxin family protein n=1 Tax=Thiohalorhabdus methylotrophus TaxID=3242694 RepID=A0ABV4TQL0_9GAMM